MGVYCCDNCDEPPERWDATEAARMALSCVYRCHEHGGYGYGAVHTIAILRGERTDKVRERGHDQLSTFGIGQAYSEAQWRGVLRQLIALGHLRAEGEYGTLALTESARAVLRGEVPIALRQPRAPEPRSRTRSGTPRARVPAALAQLDAAAQQRFERLKAWRSEVAKAHNLPAYIVFADATLAQMAAEDPVTLADVAAISGVGAKKLEAYGQAVLDVLATAHPQASWGGYRP